MHNNRRNNSKRIMTTWHNRLTTIQTPLSSKVKLARTLVIYVLENIS